MNKKILGLMTAILVVMMALYACKKDSGGSGGGDNDPDNPFIGTWLSDDYEDAVLEITVSTWRLEYRGDLMNSGTYEANGNSATLRITKVNPDLSDAEVGDVGTAKVSGGGKTLTVTFDDDVDTFTKKEEEPGNNLFVGTWISDEYEDAVLEVKASTWILEYRGDLMYNGTYTFKGNNATLTITKVNPDLSDAEVGDEGTATVSGDGKTLTVIFDGDVDTFTKDGGTPPPPPPPPPPGDDLYREPYLGFGASMSAVKSYEDRTLSEEGDNSLVFLGENKDVNVVYYGFVSGQLDFDLVVLNCAEKKAMDFLSEKYAYVGSQDGIEYFETSDETTYVALYYHSQVGLSVEYGLWADKSSFPTIKKSIKADLLKSHK